MQINFPALASSRAIEISKYLPERQGKTTIGKSNLLATLV
jgi:hypothetical protein